MIERRKLVMQTISNRTFDAERAHYGESYLLVWDCSLLTDLLGEGRDHCGKVVPVRLIDVLTVQHMECIRQVPIQVDGRFVCRFIQNGEQQIRERLGMG